MKCVTCGNDIPDGAKFCGVCGISLATPPSDSVVDDRPTESGQGIAYDGEGLAELPMIEFIDAIKRGFQNYFKFSGRATRAEYWWFVLFTQLLGLAGIVPVIGWIIGPLASIASIIPSISLSVRRLHDIGKSGWWMMVWVGSVLIWVFWFIFFVAGLGNMEDENWIQEESDAFWGQVAVSAGVLLIASVALMIVWVVWFVRKGDKGPNKYGPDPRQVTIDNLE
jgi:uncharacterized membrane protein YhaH (DUF805 family)